MDALARGMRATRLSAVIVGLLVATGLVSPWLLLAWAGLFVWCARPHRP